MNSYSCCTPSKKESRKIASLSSLLRLVVDESKLQVLCILRQGEHCVCELEKHVNLSQSLISHHLSDLRELGLVENRKNGLRVYYHLTSKGKHITTLLFQIPEKEEKL